MQTGHLSIMTYIFEFFVVSRSMTMPFENSNFVQYLLSRVVKYYIKTMKKNIKVSPLIKIILKKVSVGNFHGY